ncbi:hypothetical protein PV682_19985 [Streptomyces niveiscabiei]|uniref:hypothetical protein n=1 Tax=Streptomyces niveiscabiei TaxID=164115 RepID=UPI0029A7C3CB|nr:hypothetical protein [Streptomyces niveiscabiei]MDX3383728.1 hypothetical protein [Streptomyces niveiscabiei]
MSEAVTLDDLAVALRALRLLTVDFGHLPAPVVNVTDIFPDQVKLSFYDDLGAFESWREALGIAPGAVVHGLQSDGLTRVLKTSVEYAGATLELTGFAEVPAPELSGASA